MILDRCYYTIAISASKLIDIKLYFSLTRYPVVQIKSQTLIHYSHLLYTPQVKYEYIFGVNMTLFHLVE